MQQVYMVVNICNGSAINLQLHNDDDDMRVLSVQVTLYHGFTKLLPELP